MARAPKEAPPEPPPRKRRRPEPAPAPETAGEAVCLSCRRDVRDHAKACLYGPGQAARRKKVLRSGVDLRSFDAVLAALRGRKG